MRVISGYLKRKNLLGYEIESTRPTMDRVKESMFASLQNDTSGAIVLDLFSGTGSLGIEAISMDARHCYFVDNNKDINKYLVKNINNLDIANKCTIIAKDYKEALLYFKEKNIKFNIVLVDAPYQMKVMEEVINAVINYDLLLLNGTIVLEYSFDNLKDDYPTLKLIKNKKYGDKYIRIYRKIV